MLHGLFILLACQLIGEAVMRFLGAPVPGPVFGIVLLLAFLALSARFGRRDEAAPDAPLGGAADGLLRHLGLLFVPAGVGVAQSSELILANGAGIVLVLLGSTVATMLVAVGVFRLVRRLTGQASA